MYAFSTSDDAVIVTTNHEDKLVWLESGSGMPIDLCVLTGNVVEGKAVDEQNRNYIAVPFIVRMYCCLFSCYPSFLKTSIDLNALP